MARNILRRSIRLSAVLLAAGSTAAMFMAPACAPESPDDPEAQVEDSNDVSDGEALSAGDAIARAEQWTAAKLHYCQAPNHERDYDSACSKYCDRKDNDAWDPYRSDCSGLVSWAWNLPAPGRTTDGFAPFKTDITKAIDATDLQPGDAVNNSEHVMLFKKWVTKGKRAVFIEEPGCSSSTPYAHELTSDVSIDGSTIFVDWNGHDFTAIRYKNLHQEPPSQKVPPNPTVCHTMKKGQGLGRGDALDSCDGRFKLDLQSDGNLVLYEGKKALWASHTTSGYALDMQSDGNLVLYDPWSNPLWASHTSGHPGVSLSLQNDGNAVIYDGSKAIWAAGTGGH